MVAILGLSAFYHDSAAFLVIDGDVAAAAQEERFSRVKHDHNFPSRAVRYCLREAGLRPETLSRSHGIPGLGRWGARRSRP